MTTQKEHTPLRVVPHFSRLQEWIALGKKDARYLQYATGGIGSPGHFAGALLQSLGKLPVATAIDAIV